jgi:hypothetical protein
VVASRHRAGLAGARRGPRSPGVQG